jgi:hypothetical protein
MNSYEENSSLIEYNDSNQSNKSKKSDKSDITNKSSSSLKSVELSEINKKIEEHQDKLDIFFDKDIWEIKNISNYKLKKILDDIHKLKKKISNKKIFNIDLFYHLEINDPKLVNKEIQKEISKIKKDNIHLFKIHSELFFQYHQLYYQIAQLKKQIKFIPYIIDTTLIPTQNNNPQIEYVFQSNLCDKINIENFVKYINLDYTEEISRKLVENINNIKFPNLHSIDNIILFDCENLLKSFWIQNILKKYLTESEYNNYFDTWINGYTIHTNAINENMSMSEFSQSTKYIEPYTSLNISLNDKIKLVNILIKNYFSSYYNICIFNSKNELSIIQLLNNSDNVFHININYNKNDIREQDDHLILYLYYYLKKIDKKVFILSNDHFKYFSCNNLTLDLKEIKILYDFDNNKTKYTISNSKNDIIYVNKKFYQIYINNIIPIDIFSNLNEEKELIILKTTLFKFINKIYIKNLSNSDLDEIINICNKIKEYIKDINIFFDEIFKFIESKTKKEIFKIMLTNISNNNIFSDEFQNSFVIKLNSFKDIIDIFLVLKFIKLNYIEESFLQLYIDIFDSIVFIFDKIDDSIDKIRKLSHGNCKYKVFNQLNSIYLYFKKIGFFKKIL